MKAGRELAVAMRRHQEGDVHGAESAYRCILEKEPRHPDALHLLGVVCHQRQAETEAAAWIQQAIALNPRQAAYHCNLGAVHYAVGRGDAAEACYRTALRLSPRYAEAHHNLGLLLKDRGDSEAALEHFRLAVRHRPDYPEAHNNLGLLLQEAERLEAAAGHFATALRLRPDYPDAHNNLGAVLQAQGDLPQAEAHYREALRRNPHYAEAHSNLGLLLQGQGHAAEALACYQEALRLDPRFAKAHNNLGVLRQEQGRLAEAQACFDRAVQEDPAYGDAHWNRALLWLLVGDFRRGWPEYEWRWRHRKGAPSRFPAPAWDGAPFEGRTLLLHVEQGLGDTLQFVRYAPLAKARGGSVVLGCQGPLARLLHGCPGLDAVVPEGAPLPPYDLQLPLLSLPGIFGTDADSIPAATPYLQAPAEVSPAVERLLAIRGNALRVGIVWAGNPDHKNDRNRSCPLEYFRALAAIPDVALFSLQKGAATSALQAEAVDGLTDLAPHLLDFADTAAAVGRLDLVICVDTSVAHLAGALGQPAWVVLPCAPDWRWQLEREDSPWYPTLRLFRQPQPGDWPSVFARLADALAHAAAAHARGMAWGAACSSSAASAHRPRPETPATRGAVQAAHHSGAPHVEAEFTVASALLDAQGQPRFVLRLPEALRADPGIAFLCDHETRYGGYEYPSRRFLDLHLQPGDLFIDVGAHCGIYSLTAATRWPGQVAGLAIEPLPENAAILRRNLALHASADRVEVVEAAAGAAPGEATLHRDGTMGGSLYPLTEGPAPQPRLVARVVTLDGLLADRPHLAGRRTFLKIDAEGHEPEVIEGARRLLATGCVAAIIWEKGALYDQAPHHRRMLAMLDSLRACGFTQLRFPHENLGGALVPFVPNHERCNVFALAPGFAVAPSYDKPAGPAAPAVPAAPRQPTAADHAAYTKALAEVRGSDAGRWADPANLSAAWDGRAARVAAHIPRGTHVLDVGAGAMALRRFLDTSVRYTPADIVAREPGCLVADLNQGQFPAGRFDYVTMLGVLEYLHDLPGVLRRARAAAPRAIFTYSLYAGGERDGRRALGWFNDFTATELSALLAEAGWQVSSVEAIENNQILLMCRDGGTAGACALPSLPQRRRVLVMGFHNAANFGDRLGYHLIPGMLPSSCDVAFGTFQPWHVPEGAYDLVVVGIGNSLFAPLLTDELQRLVEAAPRSVGIFGTQYRESLPVDRLQRLLDSLTVWYARYEEDLYLYARGREHAHHLGDWLSLLCPMGVPSLAQELVIRPEFLQREVPLDRVIQDIQRYQRVRSARIHPLLVALHSASVTAYEEQREMGDGQVSGKFRSLLMDIFEHGYPEGQPFVVNRHLVAAYQARVRTRYAELCATLRRLLEPQ